MAQIRIRYIRAVRVMVRACLSLVALGGAAFALAAPAAADDAGALLAKHRAFAGWSAADGSIASLHLTGTQFVRAKDGTETVVFSLDELRVGIFYRLASTYVKRGSTSVSGFYTVSSGGQTQARFWTSTNNGFVVPNLSDYRGALLARRVIFGEANDGLPSVLRKPATVAGVEYAVVRQTPPSGKPIDLYIDTTTGAYERLAYDPDGVDPTVVDIDAYADVLPGKKVVSAWHFDGSQMRTRYDTITANQALPANALAPPPVQARWTFGGGVPIPIDTKHDSVRVRATVNGVDGLFELDTGASDIAFTDAFADRAHLKRQQALHITGIASGNAPALHGAVVHVDSMAFADGSKLENVDALSGMQSFPGESELDGLLGFDFLGGAIVDVDFDKSAIKLFDPKTSAPDEHAGVVVVPDLASGQPVIPVKLNGSITSQAMLDLGNGAPVLIPHSLVSKIPMLAMQLYRIGGVTGGAEVDECGELASIEIGPIVWQNPGACFSGSVGSTESLIGYDFLKNFNITFDYPDGKMLMIKRP